MMFSNKVMKLPSKLEMNRWLKYIPTQKIKIYLTFKFQEINHRDVELSATSKQKNDVLQASCNISLFIAKSGKSHTIEKELILPTLRDILF